MFGQLLRVGIRNQCAVGFCPITNQPSVVPDVILRVDNVFPDNEIIKIKETVYIF